MEEIKTSDNKSLKIGEILEIRWIKILLVFLILLIVFSFGLTVGKHIGRDKRGFIGDYRPNSQIQRMGNRQNRSFDIRSNQKWQNNYYQKRFKAESGVQQQDNSQGNIGNDRQTAPPTNMNNKLLSPNSTSTDQQQQMPKQN